MPRYPKTDFVILQEMTGYTNIELVRHLHESYCNITKWRKGGLKSCPERVIGNLINIICYGGKTKTKVFKDTQIETEVQKRLHMIYKNANINYKRRRNPWKRKRNLSM